MPNYDKKSNKTKSAFYNFIVEEYSMLVCGQSGCGETNVVMHMLREPLVYYDKIYLYTPNQHKNR